jgi:2,4-dichlorophenol 6-monooxygenase
LLDTYEAERRPADGRNVQRSLENGMNHFRVAEAIGLNRAAGAEQNLALLGSALRDRPHRRAVLEAVALQSMEFREHAVEYGYAYASSAIVPDGTPRPDPVDEIRVYAPSTRPGAPLPHAWLEDPDGARCSTLDLVKPGRFLLIAGEGGADWCEAAREMAAEAGVPLDAVRIGHATGDYRDPRCAWLARREIGPRGAVLVRPDRFVAWRSCGESTDPHGALEAAFHQILAKES